VPQRFCRESLIWRQLRHPNVLPFIGVDAQTFASTNFLCMVSPWMERGTIMDYIKSPAFRPAIDCNRLVRLLLSFSPSFLMFKRLHLHSSAK
jgi:serine/threonine protein kinase